MEESRPDDLAFSVVRTSMLSRDDEDALARLFAQTYRDADVDYLRDGLGRLDTIALAHHGGSLVGFALAEGRHLDLPRLGRQVVRLGGLACVAPELRRRGILRTLQERAFLAGPRDAPGLACGRMAHPATYRHLSRLPGAVPRIGVPPTPWQQEVGAAVAAAYGVARFDPETFVCAGRGRPIGHPLLDVEATPDEWALFERIDREKGESLLGMAWVRDVPAGW